MAGPATTGRSTPTPPPPMGGESTAAPAAAGDEAQEESATGAGPQGWVSAATELPYTIRFENSPDAPAPAQVATITQQLDPDLDWRTFRLTEFRFMGLTIEVPEGRAFYSGLADLTEEHGFLVEYEGGIDVVTGIATWILRTIDPATGTVPVNPALGFLPPSDRVHMPGHAESQVGYTIRARRDVPSGTVIDTQARVAFDTKEPVDTPLISITLDAAAPTSAVEALAPTTDAAQFLVSWSGDDEPTGSALAAFTVYISDNGGPFTAWLADTTLTEAMFTGQPGHEYRFYSVAEDNAGNVEQAPLLPDAQIGVSGDTAPPSISSMAIASPNPRNTAVSTVDVTFSELVNLASLGPDDVTLTHNGQEVSLAGSLSFQFVSDTTYRINGLAALTAADGTYVLAVNAAGVQDLASKPGIGTASMMWIMDTLAPTSTVAALPRRATSLSFPITVAGSDPLPAAGVAAAGISFFDVFVKVDSGPFTLWQSLPASQTTAMFTAESKHTYAFRSVARDAAGNTELQTVAIEASTYVPDLLPPVTEVTSVDATTPTFTINWSGNDLGGSTVYFFDIFVEIDQGPAQKIGSFFGGFASPGATQSGLTNFEALVDGQEHAYRFYSVGWDRRRNREIAPSDPQDDVVVTASFPVPGQLQVTTFDVQRGVTQRSFVNHVDVGFNQTIGLQAITSSVNDADATNDRARLRRFGLDGGGLGELVSLAGRAQLVDRVFELDFGAEGIGGNRNSTVGDGYYALDFDLDGDGSFETTRNFYRLLGDVNGDRIVNDFDFSAILSALGQIGDNLNEDVNGDGVVNSLDRTLAVRSRGRAVGSSLHLDD